MTSPTRMLLVGFGRIGQEYAKALEVLGIEFVVCVTEFPSEVTRRRISDFPRTKFISEAQIGEHEFSQAILAIPPESNLSVTKLLLGKGVGKFLYEKPGALSLERLSGLSALLSSAKAKGWIAYNRRCYASVLEARDRVAFDGGVSSVVLDFTEVWQEILGSGFSSHELMRWIIYNSSHLFDLVFFVTKLQPKEVYIFTDGDLDMHPAGAVFSGSGLFLGGGVFSFFADWNSKSRWSVEFRTTKRSLLLRPLEKLFENKTHFGPWSEVLSMQAEDGIKPGIVEMVRAFNHEDPTVLKSFEEQAWLIDFLTSTFYRQG